MEFKRWCPGLKILTYFGSQKERKLKRTGWSKDNSFHVCITSYKLVIQDHFAFRRKKWYYMVLDEAQSIKNFRSQRWQTLLRFNTKRRLLLTGTPLQNDVMELWSLMHFLMPHIFTSQQDFKEWFSNPFNQSMNQNQSLNMMVVQRLQSILRPFLLRRMKKDVEKQLPQKIEHVVKCDLSRRQRFLYDEYINNNRTQHTLQEADFFSIMNVLMQLRKVCNHPDLFEPRPIESPFFQDQNLVISVPHIVWNALERQKENEKTFKDFNMILRENEIISKMMFASQIENFPQRTFVEALQNSRIRSSGTMCTMRPLEEGDSVGFMKPINCNELSVNNTQALEISFPGRLSFTYLNAASMPFLSSYFSLNSLDELKYGNKEERFDPDTEYLSSIQYEHMKIKLMKFGEKLITFAHADYKNRLRLTTSPVYGKD
jgi:SNF2 family DNA or RNA helicase